MARLHRIRLSPFSSVICWHGEHSVSSFPLTHVSFRLLFDNEQLDYRHPASLCVKQQRSPAARTRSELFMTWQTYDRVGCLLASNSLHQDALWDVKDSWEAGTMSMNEWLINERDEFVRMAAWLSFCWLKNGKLSVYWFQLWRSNLTDSCWRLKWFKCLVTSCLFLLQHGFLFIRMLGRFYLDFLLCSLKQPPHLHS